MSKRPFRSSLPILGYAFLVSALFLFVRGYQFNTDDQAEHLPQIYQMLDSELYPNDYFVNASNSIFTVRFYYEKLVLAVANTVGLEWGLFILTFLCIALMAYSFSRIAEELFGDRWSVLLAPMLAMFVFYNFTVGGNHVMYGSFISSTIAKGISAFGILLFVRKHYGLGGLFIGIATLFQPLVGLQLFLILGGVQLLFRQDLKNGLVLAIPYLTLAAFILVPVFGRQFGETVANNKELYFEILYRFRNHHHYIPSLFPVTHYIKFFGLLGLGFLSYFILKPNDKRFFLGFVAMGLLGMVVYWFVLECLHIWPIGKVQWFKVTVWISAFSSIMLAGLLGQRLSGFIPLARMKGYLLPLSLVLFVLITIAITNSKYLPESHQYRYMVGNRVYSDLEKMHLWIADSTAKHVSVLVSPDDNSFSCEAKRSMPIHFQAIVHEPFFMLPWYNDFTDIYGVSLNNLEGIDARAQAVKLYRTRNYTRGEPHIDYRLDNEKECTFGNELGTVIHREGDWVLTEFVPSK